MINDPQRALNIGRIVANHQWKNGYQFYGSEYALDLAYAEIARLGVKKMFFERKRDFVVSSILSFPKVYEMFSESTIRLSHRFAYGLDLCWLGTGELSHESCDAMIAREGPVTPSLMLLQIEIAPVLDQLMPYLERPAPTTSKDTEPTLVRIDGKIYRVNQ